GPDCDTPAPSCLISLFIRLFYAIVFDRSILPDEGGVMPSGPAHADAASEPGDPLPAPDWMSAAEWEAWCDATAPGDTPPVFGEDQEPGAEPGACIGQVAGFAVEERRLLLAEHAGAAEDLMSRSHDLAVKLPGTMALFGAGRLPQAKVKIIVDATAPLDRDEARAAAGRVLGRAGRLTPGGL